MMKNLNMKPFLALLGGFSVLILFIASWINGSALRGLLDVVRLIPTVTTADCAAYFVFTTWLWRWKLLQGWLIPFPDLNGTWEGQIETNWRDAEGKTPGPVPTMVTIKQRFTRMSVVVRTAESESHSYLEGFLIDPEAQMRRLCYSYTGIPKVTLRERSTPHDGTVLLNIVGNPVQKLEGGYWTQRQTLGTMTLRFRTKKLLDELPSDFPPHPMSAGNRQSESD